MLTEEQPRLVGFTRDESRARHRELHQVAHVLDDLSPFSEPDGFRARRATDEEREAASADLMQLGLSGQLSDEQRGQIDRIDNPSLRRLISGERGE